jgi:hypothetical protein
MELSRKKGDPMKAGMRAGRFGVLAASLLVLIILAAVVSHAAVTFTAANSSVLAYTLAAGSSSVAITPPANTSVLLTGTNTTAGNFGIGTVTLVHIPATMIRWVGLESPPSTTVVQGDSSIGNAHVVYLDYKHTVDIKIVNPDRVYVVNVSTSTQTGTVKEIW